MDRASSLIFPGSRTLAGWWRQLASYQPQALWVGYAHLHRVEAPVQVLATKPVEPLAQMVLKAAALESPCARLVALQDRLRLPTAILQQVFRGLERLGLVASVDAEAWQLTETGRRAAQTGSYPATLSERRVFPFVERIDGAGTRGAPPHFLPILSCPGASWPVDDAHRFDADAVKSCIAQADAWKQTFAFPGEVQALISDTLAEPWQRIIVDRPERVLLALVLAGKELLGFAVKAEGWALEEKTPALRVPSEALSIWLELAGGLTPLAWRDAWRAWCRERQLPTNEVEICSVTYRAPRLEVQAPPRLMQRLQAARSDLFKGDAWVLAGDQFMRPAAQLAVRQAA